MKTTTTTPKNVYQMVTDRIIAQMEQGIIPWRKPWHSPNNANPAEAIVDGYMTSSNHPKLIVKNSIKAYICRRHGHTIGGNEQAPILSTFNQEGQQ